jgi:predicted nucleic acid-binding protein
MASDRLWLVDKSALAWLAASPDAEAWFDRVNRGLVRVATLTALEVGFSAQSLEDWDMTLRQPPFALMPLEYVTPAAEARALEVQRSLAAHGHHRAPSVADLMVAAVAELGRLVVLHVDKDFDLIAQVTGQPVERLALPE